MSRCSIRSPVPHLSAMPDGARATRFQELFVDGTASRTVSHALVEEAPVAIEINGVAYAVMMATPCDLEDYALGFCLSEQLIAQPGAFLSASASQLESGWVLRVQIDAAAAAPLIERARLRLSEGSCGLCGLESLDQVMRPLPPVAATIDVPSQAVFRAVSALPERQVLGKVTRAAHAAAFCAPDGAVLIVREDIGRHNALDKLIGAMARDGTRAGDGFLLLTARCSFELVQKAIVAGCPVLVTISAASTLAVDCAARHGLRLISLARADSFLSS